MEKRGFTLIELLLVMGIFAILAALATVNLLRPQTQASVSSTTQVLTADVKGQQLKTMAGDTEGQTAPGPQGIYFEAARYTLFQGSAYSAGDPANKVVNLENNLTLTGINFPTSQLVFARRSGEVAGFVAGSDSVTVQNTQSSEQKTITVNRYGTIVIN
ncbi:MAG: type II secretion system protein [Candidatus Blackburnbacteria bacterium]|nr:type II secretion system protein [Candidatus Blackburnbacteria bacterium]